MKQENHWFVVNDERETRSFKGGKQKEEQTIIREQIFFQKKEYTLERKNTKVVKTRTQKKRKLESFLI